MSTLLEHFGPFVLLHLLINYGQIGRKGSRHTDKHLCGIVGRVITSMTKRGRLPGREESRQAGRQAVAHRSAGQQGHAETDKYDRSTKSGSVR